jgi:N-acetylneuraminate lyase
MGKLDLRGLNAAVFTPMNEDGTLALGRVGPIADGVIASGASGFYVCGSTGEGPSLTTDERKAVCQAYVEAAAGRVPVVVQVGHNSLAEARGLAAHAQEVGADGISAVPPLYYRAQTVDELVACLQEVVAGADALPFYYYHVPAMSGLHYDMTAFLEEGAKRLPTLAGIKYSAPTVHELQECLAFDGGRFTILFGCDEMFLSGLVAGAPGAVGSTYNFVAPLYSRIMDAFGSGDLAEARRLQKLSVDMVRVVLRYRGQAGLKAMMKLVGLDSGPNRLPLITLTPAEVESMRGELEAIGFFDWGCV